MRGHLIIAAALLLAACQPSGNPVGDVTAASLGSGNTMRIWTDPESGCRYFIYRNNAGNASTGGISIRFNGDGSADCPGSSEQVSVGGDVINSQVTAR